MSKSMQKTAAHSGTAGRVESSQRRGPTHETIACRAYRIWEEHGRPHGTAEQDWYQAEAELRTKPWFRVGVRER